MNLQNTTIDRLIRELCDNRLGKTKYILNSPYDIDSLHVHSAAIFKKKKKQCILCGFNRAQSI